MSRPVTPQRKNGALGVMVGYSAIAHVIVFFILLNFQFPAHFHEAPVYYVDVLDLPVAHPQAGTPAVAPGETKGAPAPPPPAPPAPREMTLPAKPPAKPSPKQAAPSPKKPDAEETPQDFAKRIESLERDAEARRMAATIAAMKQKQGSKGPIGMPGATGTEAGSDYASYIQSRLKDAFKTTIAFQSKTPEVTVRITISRTGRISRVRTERSTGDKVFEDAVSRAIAKAEKNFPPPPKGEEFDLGYVFRPQGVGKN
jgi:colicin import membrane protein